MENLANPHAQVAPHARYVALAGPTASGKTAVAIAIARHHAVEIVSVDSALVYRGMDIGTAKPSRAERAAVAHHLIDIRDPLNAYSAAEFAQDAQALIRDISARGKLPLLVGGTMLYFKALFQGLDAMPAANAAIRAEIEAQAAREGWPAMHRRLADVDPITAARLQPADSQRIQRALEVFRVSGQPLSHFHTAKPPRAEQQVATLISLEPTDRAWLHARIAQRFDAMLAEGFLDEVRALRTRGDLHPDLPSMRCVGYRQAWETLDGIATMQTLRDRGVFATRQLAKRQITWLRAMPQRRVVPCESADAIERVLDHVAAHLRQGHAESDA